MYSCYKSPNDRKEVWKGELRAQESQRSQLWLAGVIFHLLREKGVIMRDDYQWLVAAVVTGVKEQGWVVRRGIRKLGVHDGGKPLVARKPLETFVNIAILHSRSYCC